MFSTVEQENMSVACTCGPPQSNHVIFPSHLGENGRDKLTSGRLKEDPSGQDVVLIH